MSYAAVVDSIDASLRLSPYSELATSGLRAGFEAAYDMPLSEVAAGDVAQVVQDLVSGAAITAIQTVTDIPLVGWAVGFVADVVRGILSAEADAELREQEARRLCQIQERSRRPIGTGLGGATYPADVLGWYLDWARPSVQVTNGEGDIPSVGEAAWLYGYGYAHNYRSPPALQKLQAAQYVILRRAAIDRGVVPADAAGPRATRRLQWLLIANAIGAARCTSACPGDGGVTLWPLALDVLLDQRSRVTPAWVDFLASHYVVQERGRSPEIVGPNDNGGKLYPECALPQSRAAVARMIESWRLTVTPSYAQDRERAAALARDVDAEVRRLLAPRMLPGAALRAVSDALRARRRPSRLARAALLGAAGAGAVLAFRPEWVAAVARGARAIAGR